MMDFKTATALLPATGQVQCYDLAGGLIPCGESAQDGHWQAGVSWPSPRFAAKGETVRDRLTGLVWPRNAALSEFSLSWEEALDFVQEMNDRQTFGWSDWRLPNRNELFGLVSHVHINPCLGPDAPFDDVFPGYYWTSTTCARLPNQAWYVHLGGARVFKGMKHGSYMVWPVRGGEGIVRLPQTGQRLCYDTRGNVVPCAGTSQDGETLAGVPWPDPRFEINSETVLDRLTGLTWTLNADLGNGPVSWDAALNIAESLNAARFASRKDWRLPNIRELASLTDMAAHSPALPAGHPFVNVDEACWSSTTSVYDPAYAWTLYFVDGPVGVGHKVRPEFHAWAVSWSAGPQGRHCLGLDGPKIAKVGTPNQPARWDRVG